jgi:PHP family Zn ribbon phosphoesterase
MIEHLLKWLKLVSLLDHINEKATYAFLDRVLNKFGTQIEVLIDEGKNSMGSYKSCVKKY